MNRQLGQSVGPRSQITQTPQGGSSNFNDLQSDSDVRFAKHSVGIACIRFVGTQPQILLVCKRYTYAFDDFIHGRYPQTNKEKIFNGMTVEEKLDILSMNFDMMWYRIWLHSKRDGYYIASKNKFETQWLIDGGAKLRKYIAKSKNALRVWEMPKGRKKSKNEPDVVCAIREFAEETAITKKHYRFLPGLVRKYSSTDAGITYVNTYYVACLLSNIEVSIRFDTLRGEQPSELCDIRWMDINAVRSIDPTGKLENMIGPIFRTVKRINRV